MNSLVEQVMTTTLISGKTYRQTTSNTVSYSSNRGWFMKLVADGKLEGERVIFAAALDSGVVFFNTVVPANEDPCINGATSWRMAVSAADGSTIPKLFNGTDDIAGAQNDRGLLTAPATASTTTTTTLPSGQTQTVITIHVYAGTSGTPGGAGAGITDNTYTLTTVSGTPTPAGTPQQGRMSWRQLQ